MTTSNVLRLIPENERARNTGVIKSQQDAVDLIANIVYQFEQFLDYKGIEICNYEKEQAVYEDGASADSIDNLYGTDYVNLFNDVRDVLLKYGCIKEEYDGDKNYGG